jgi:transposase-like protein
MTNRPSRVVQKVSLAVYLKTHTHGRDDEGRPDSGEHISGLPELHITDPLRTAHYLEAIRWPYGPVRPHCGESEARALQAQQPARRLWKCAGCRKQFTVTVGPIFESSHIPLNKWLLAFHLPCSSKEGMSAHQLHRMLGITHKSAWFMARRLREAMKQPSFTSLGKGLWTAAGRPVEAGH